MNMTLMEKARSMLSGVGLGQELWAEAVGTTCYLVNRSPSSVLDDKTPHEVWSGNKPSLQHLRVFGFDAYVHVPKENRSKMDKKAEKCIFIDYKDGVKGYNLWNPETKKTVYSRDVVFREVKDVSSSLCASRRCTSRLCTRIHNNPLFFVYKKVLHLELP
jgi:hypothetical protein